MPEVLAEIRDRPTRRRLAALPCELRLRRPRPDLLRLGEYRTGAPRPPRCRHLGAPDPGPESRGYWSPRGPAPRPHSRPAVTEFSKKTGDYPSLSAADLQVLALTCQLQAETDGPGCLRWEPQDKVGATPGMGPRPPGGPSNPPAASPGAAQLHPAAPRGPTARRRLPPARQGEGQRHAAQGRGHGSPGGRTGAPVLCPPTAQVPREGPASAQPRWQHRPL